MELYIKSTGIVSGAGSNMMDSFLDKMPEISSDRYLSVEPDYAGIIPPMQLRRMSKAVRTGIAASKQAMKRAGVEKPDALSIGTAIGCLQDTEVFLGKLVDQEEQMLTPTAFIQSTHNTVGGQIALLSGCYGHNLTYVHRGHSFEHAMINTQLYLNDHKEEYVLVGGIDELTDNSYKALVKGTVYSNEELTSDSVLTTSSVGAIAGEGATFFVVTDKPEGTAVCVKDVDCFTGKDETAAKEKIAAFLKRNELENSVDLFVSGISNDKRTQSIYKSIQNECFNGVPVMNFKHLSGEYATASAFALGLLTHCVTQNHFPDFIVQWNLPSMPKKVVMINNYMHYTSCWYLEVV